MIIPSLIGNMYGMSAKTKINSDMSNRELVEKVEALLSEKKQNDSGGKKKNPARIMHIEYGDPGAKDAFERKRQAILKAIEAIDAQQEE